MKVELRDPGSSFFFSFKFCWIFVVVLYFMLRKIIRMSYVPRFYLSISENDS